MEVKEINIGYKTIINDLHNGLTWYKKDDLGYGSIEQKYNVPLSSQIDTIRKHPKLKDVDTIATIINIIDDDISPEKIENSIAELPFEEESITIEHPATSLEATEAFNSI